MKTFCRWLAEFWFPAEMRDPGVQAPPKPHVLGQGRKTPDPEDIVFEQWLARQDQYRREVATERLVDQTEAITHQRTRWFGKIWFLNWVRRMTKGDGGDAA